MIKILKQMIRMKAAIWVNTFIFYFRKLWVVGKLMPDTLYANYGLKDGLSIAAVAVRLLAELGGKALYLLCFVVLPVMGGLGGQGQGFAAMVQILFFLNCLIGAFGESQIFAVTRDKITCIKYMHMNARDYVRGGLVFKYVPFFFFYLPCLLVAARMLGGTMLQGFLLWLALVSFRMMGEAFALLVFDRTGKVLCRNMAYAWLIILVGCACAYGPLGLHWNWPVAAVLLHPVSVVLFTAAGAASLFYITVGYRGYERNYHRSLDINFLLSTIMKKSSSSSFTEVEIKEKDLDIEESGKERYRKLEGYALLNALFFSRHRRQLVKPIYYRLAVTLFIFLAGAAFYVYNSQAAVQISRNMTLLLPSFVFVMYCMTVADKACRAMFYNCDKSLLHYAYYRQPGVILENFKIRFRKVSLYNLTVGAAVCLAAVGFCLLCGGSLLTMDMFLFCITVLLLTVLFTAHHLCMYYLFQPYSENLSTKNPFFKITNFVMYMLCFICLQIEAGSGAFTVVVLSFTVIYSIGALVLVYRFAPRTFRIK